MKKLFSGIFLTGMLLCAALPAYGANIQINVDSVAITSDVAPETVNNHTMVPLRVISENLGAKVTWANSEVTLSKSGLQVMLKLSDGAAVRNGETVLLDAKPYLKNSRVMVPLRFLAETFGCAVNYKDRVVTVDTEPLIIDGVQVKALQQEYHMTMGGVVQQIKGNAYNKAIYDLVLENKGSQAEAPAKYSWMVDIDTPGAYYKIGQYDFLDLNGNSIQRFDIYGLIEALPAEILAGYPKALIYDATGNQWYLFSDTAIQSINQLIDTATKNGFLTVISNTVV
ncbi:copper amine oxidase N-terminal domain-containing protein [Candidatus Formimonas warabiya]|uniref:Copper amine oxidase n=1 Tax=Formimonas warabiya TaxID=1761012 RepID=A0A3G1KMB8_FORW1|nr:copper amine oxidase N-terminal domain-containing protein [Candidatus Formimonas warabiya]ATW23577.1 copper amine oxidase [Candidatus Formimonas warabiya]